jgi:hypothetical protein
MSVALYPRNKKLAATMNKEFAMPSPVWGRLWLLFGCCYGENIVPQEQWQRCCSPDLQVDSHQRISAEQVQEILSRIDMAIAQGTFERDMEEWKIWTRDIGIRVPAPDSPAGSYGDLIIGASLSGICPHVGHQRVFDSGLAPGNPRAKRRSNDIRRNL